MGAFWYGLVAPKPSPKGGVHQSTGRPPVDPASELTHRQRRRMAGLACVTGATPPATTSHAEAEAWIAAQEAAHRAASLRRDEL